MSCATGGCAITGTSGVCEIEMKRDSCDGRVKMIEANPRLTGNGDAVPYADVDVWLLHYLDLIGKPVTPVVGDGRDFRHIVLRSDPGQRLAPILASATTKRSRF